MKNEVDLKIGNFVIKTNADLGYTVSTFGEVECFTKDHKPLGETAYKECAPKHYFGTLFQCLTYIREAGVAWTPIATVDELRNAVIKSTKEIKEALKELGRR